MTMMRLSLIAVPIVLACGGPTKTTTTAQPQASAVASADAPRGPASPEQAALARTRAHTIATAAATWIGAHPEGVCPSVDVLKADRTLDAMADDKDTWGRPFAVSCTETDVMVSSAGADGVSKSADDVLDKVAVAPPIASSGPPASRDVPFRTNDAGAFSRDAVVAQVDQKVGACRAKANDPSASGAVAFKIVVRADGTVKSVAGVRSKMQLKSAVMLACVLKELARAQFGTTGAQDDTSFEVP